MKGLPHAWNVTPVEAIALQTALSAQVDAHTPIDLDGVELVAGVDVSVKDNISRAAIVVMTFPGLVQLEVVTAQIATPFPYISGLLSFREGAVILQAAEQLKHHPDVYLFDGQGIAHPRRVGLASHIGLWWDAPTVGCAKKRLTGKHDDVPAEKGAFVPLWDGGEQIGVVLRTRSNVKPVYISPGHKASIDSACELALRCATRYRLPEPIRAAHHAAHL